MEISEKHRHYWRKNITVTVILLSLWFIATYIPAFFARELADVKFLGFPLPFYMAAQGSLLVYLGIILFYAIYMARLDKEHDVAEGDES